MRAASRGTRRRRSGNPVHATESTSIHRALTAHTSTAASRTINFFMATASPEKKHLVRSPPRRRRTLSAQRRGRDGSEVTPYYYYVDPRAQLRAQLRAATTCTGRAPHSRPSWTAATSSLGRPRARAQRGVTRTTEEKALAERLERLYTTFPPTEATMRRLSLHQQRTQGKGRADEYSVTTAYAIAMSVLLTRPPPRRAARAERPRSCPSTPDRAGSPRMCSDRRAPPPRGTRFAFSSASISSSVSRTSACLNSRRRMYAHSSPALRTRTHRRRARACRSAPPEYVERHVFSVSCARCARDSNSIHDRYMRTTAGTARGRRGSAPSSSTRGTARVAEAHVSARSPRASIRSPCRRHTRRPAQTAGRQRRRLYDVRRWDDVAFHGQGLECLDGKASTTARARGAWRVVWRTASVRGRSCPCAPRRGACAPCRRTPRGDVRRATRRTPSTT